MITLKMALTLGSKKLKDYLCKNGFFFKISISEINDWLSHNGQDDLQVSLNSESNELEITLKDSKDSKDS